ncbi:MAG: Serine protease Do-like HtrA [Chlamydiae bacterium]|nr:Serine protease Do-like HtrA [Chlamydiota bacterium]
MTDYEVRHEKIALPCVRIRANKAGGSGTAIYSKDGSTYVLTNHHVVTSCISIEKKWSALLKSERKIDVFEQVNVHFFDYQYSSRSIGGTTIQSDIMCYDKDEDLALVKLRSSKLMPIAELYPRGQESKLRIGMPVICVGAGMGEPPVQTGGFLSQFGQEIDRKEYWLGTAPMIFGNSGGALFLEESYQLIGVPSQIRVMMLGWSVDPITHLSYSVPITRIYQFLEDQRFRFIYDDSFTEEGEADVRRQIRAAEERKSSNASLDLDDAIGELLGLEGDDLD